MQGGRLPLPRYQCCLSNWLIMLRLDPSHRPPVKAGQRASNRRTRWDKQLCCLPCQSLPFSRSMLARMWIGKAGFPDPSAHSQLRQIPAADRCSPPVCRQIFTYPSTANLQSSIRSAPHKFNIALRMLHYARQESRLFLPSSHHRLSDGLDISRSVLDHARIDRTDSCSIEKQATITSDANVALQLSFFRTTEEHVPCLWPDVLR